MIISEGVESVSADLVHDSGFTGSGITVGVLDLAFDKNNAEIKSNVLESKSFRYNMDGELMPLIGLGSEDMVLQLQKLSQMLHQMLI